MKERVVKPFTMWKHFKGTRAFVITVAEHSHKDGIYARPLDMFLSEVDHGKYPSVTQKYRFEEIKEE